VVAGREQRVWPDGSARLFSVQRDAAVSLQRAEPGILVAECRYRGIRHTRSWTWGAEGVVIEDEVAGAGRPTLTLNLAPRVQVGTIEPEGPRAYRGVVECEGRPCQVRLLGVAPPEVVAGCYSEGYGRRIPNLQLRAALAAGQASLRLEFSGTAPPER
jgi:hypothetical protein